MKDHGVNKSDALLIDSDDDDDVIELPIGIPNASNISMEDNQAFSIDSVLYNQTPKLNKSFSLYGSTDNSVISRLNATSSPSSSSLRSVQTIRTAKKQKNVMPTGQDLRTKKKKIERFGFSIPSTTFDDVLCLDAFMDKLFHLSKNFDEKMIEDDPPKNLLLSGPEGSGKTFLVQAFAGREKIPLLSVSVKDFLLDENAINEAFDKAVANAPCILHLKDLQSINLKNSTNAKHVDSRLNAIIANQISKICLNIREQPVVVVGEYQYHPSQTIDWNLRTCFEAEIFMPALKKEQRLRFLQKICSNLTTEVDLEELVKRTTCYLPGDLIKVVKKASEMAMDRHYHQYKENLSSQNDYITICRKNFIPKSKITIKEEDFALALRKLVPVLKRNGFPSIPEIKMDDIGGMEEVKALIYDNILLPLENGKLADELGIDDSSDMLLWGPPGCGKTLLAKAVANQAGINFLLINGAEVLKMYQGESERTVREAFALAKSVSPCVIYFDEFEGICPIRNGGNESGSKSTIVTTLLSEMNGVLNREGVFVMASTNRPDVIDPALLRPGRIGTKIYVGLPNEKGRKAIFLATSKNGTRPRFSSDVDLDVLSSKCENFSGADCSQLIKSASRCALKRMIETGVTEAVVLNEDLTQTLSLIQPSVTLQALKKYEKLKEQFNNSHQSHLKIKPS